MACSLAQPSAAHSRDDLDRTLEAMVAERAVVWAEVVGRGRRAAAPFGKGQAPTCVGLRWCLLVRVTEVRDQLLLWLESGASDWVEVVDSAGT